jgi:hypothetical protein
MQGDDFYRITVSGGGAEREKGNDDGTRQIYGRVGALAVALGIGIGLAAAPWVASAKPATSDSSSTESSSSA